MSTAVKHFHSGMTGAPVITYSVLGSLPTLLDAVLVNGWGLNTVDSVTVASNVATVVRAAGHPFDVGMVVLIGGATPAGLNGEKRILSKTATSYTFATSGISDQVATGTITQKVAPLGFEIAFTGTNKRAYRSPNTLGPRPYLRFEHTNASTPKIAYGLAAKVMTDIDTYSDNTGNVMIQIAYAGGTSANSVVNKPWYVIGDDRGFYLCVQWYPEAYGGFETSYFGDFTSKRAADAYSFLVHGRTSENPFGAPGSNNDCFSYANWQSVHGGIQVAKGVGGIGTAQACRKMLDYCVPGTTGVALSGNNGYAFPNPADNGLLLSKFMLGDSSCYRGDIPGAYFVCHATGGTVFATGAKVEGVNSLANRTLMAVVNNGGATLWDITGPWR